MGTSDSLICAPVSGAGLALGDTYNIGKNGFGPAWYMTNFCWSNMIDYPARSVNFTSHMSHPNGQVFQVFDEERRDEVDDLSIIKYFPCFILLHSILLLWPMILWKKLYAAEAKIKLDFLISGMEEGITSIIAGLANDHSYQRDEDVIRDRLKSNFKDDPHHAEKFEIFEAFIGEQVASKKLVNVYNSRRTAFTLHLIISTGILILLLNLLKLLTDY